MAEFLKNTGNLWVLFCLFIALACASKVEARFRHYKWDVTYQYKSPDCFKKLIISINGESPGPTIIADQGDTIVVELKNSLVTENLAVHWHGIRQIGSPWSDGTEAVTQCPILPGDTFIYKFVVDRAGTFLYHAHYGLQKEAGLYGFIIVANPPNFTEPFTYDYDQRIILNDWYHKSAYEQGTGLSSIPFGWVGEPQSLLINGRGKFNCSLPSLKTGVCNASNPECSPYVLAVIPGRTYRLRIGSLASLSSLSFEIEGHNLTVVEADGHYVEPFVVKNIYLYSGETYSVLLKANQDSSRNYWAITNVVSRKPSTPNALAILNYIPNDAQTLPPTVPPTGPLWNDTTARLAQSLAIKAHGGHIIPIPAKADRTIVLLNTQNKLNGYTKWAINNVSLTLPHTPYLIALKYNLKHAFDQTIPPDNYDSENYDIFNVAKNVNTTSSSGIYRLKFNSTVDVILQNANTMNANDSETHPWHLHGHDFWVLGFGTGKFNVSEDSKKFNLVNPITKNTVPLHNYGWTAVRFHANNPGVWLFHCHVESHFFLGMSVVFEEGIEKLGELPSTILGCGETRNHHRP
ncbi:L-ascorbate oxidase [Quillaja saponaria]|uniref:L-ascorbate oxidase n=1 Tax=Quillaja saponaria TaxID=32244 RepID=A0AAD7QIL0_QUISA|nr:L-ascorbate oxidase [Quillaja saponaria]KAJ7982064.1 L-ascorbate oxidase [Quillaja saponaria]